MFFIRESIINAFREGIFPYKDEFQIDEESDEESTLENEEIGMSSLENEKSAAEKRNQQGQGLKILTPNEILSRLPTTLAQLNVKNNSGKLKNEIR